MWTKDAKVKYGALFPVYSISNTWSRLHIELMWILPEGHFSNKDFYWLKLKTIRICFLPLYKAELNAMLSHSDFHDHLWSHDAGKACHREGYITQTTNI